MALEHKWQIISKTKNKMDSNWIEEEEHILNWAENPNFEKHPLDHIAIKFIYISPEKSNNKIEHITVGILQTVLKLENKDYYSLLNNSEFLKIINKATTPNTLFDNETYDKNEWLEKTYIFDDAAMCSIPVEYEQMEKVNLKIPFIPLNLSKDNIKINCSLNIFHDLYEVIVIMREIRPQIELKSILKDGSKMGKTKKVRISDDSPKEFVFSKTKPVSGKRRTKKIHQ